MVPISLQKNLSSNNLIEFHPDEELVLIVPASLTPYSGDLILGNLSDIKCCIGKIACKNCTMLTVRLKGSIWGWKEVLLRTGKKLMYFLNDEESTFSIKGQNN